MLIYSFLALTLTEKIEYVKNNCILIMNRVEGVYIFKLYSMRRYYVEIKYKMDETQIETISVFDDIENLAPYLDKIKY